MNEITPEDQVLKSHRFLKGFIEKFDTAERGGIHDFMEVTLSKMINASIKNIDEYLNTGHKEVSANEIMQITVESYQNVLDGIKRNLDKMKQVNFK
jgi:hypothetical protein